MYWGVNQIESGSTHSDLHALSGMQHNEAKKISFPIPKSRSNKDGKISSH